VKTCRARLPSKTDIRETYIALRLLTDTQQLSAEKSSSVLAKAFGRAESDMPPYSSRDSPHDSTAYYRTGVQGIHAFGVREGVFVVPCGRPTSLSFETIKKRKLIGINDAYALSYYRNLKFRIVFKALWWAITLIRASGKLARKPLLKGAFNCNG